jgi:hypothetical protein
MTIPHKKVQEMISQNSTPRLKFSIFEDMKLIQLVKKLGTKSWKKIAQEMGTRTTRQCRERYTNYLDPSINNIPWSRDDDEMLI